MTICPYDEVWEGSHVNKSNLILWQNLIDPSLALFSLNIGILICHTTHYNTLNKHFIIPRYFLFVPNMKDKNIIISDPLMVIKIILH